MSDTLLTGLLQNVAILLAVTFLYDIIWANETAYRSRRNQLMTGLVLGCVAILLMLTNWEFSPGLVFDSRSILMVNVGLFFGPVATVAAIVVAGTYRLFMGGPGVWMGIASIVFSAATGLVWKWLRPEWRKGGRRIAELAGAGFVAHLLMLFSIFLIQDPVIRSETFRKMSLTILFIYPLFSVLVGRLLINRMDNHRAKRELVENEARYNSFINMNSDFMFMKDSSFRYVVVNDHFCTEMGKTREELLGKSDFDLFPNEIASNYNDSDKRVVESGEIVWFEEMIDGRVSETMKFPIKLSHGETGVGAIIRDSTLSHKKREMQEVLLYLSRISMFDTDLKIFLEKVHFHMKRVIRAANFYIALYDKDKRVYSYPYYVDEFDSVEDGFTESLENSLTEYVRVTGKGMLVTSESEQDIKKVFSLETYREDSPVWMGAPLMDSTLKEVIGVAAVQDYNDPEAYSEEDLLLFEIFANTIGIFIEKLTNFRQLKEAKEEAEKSDRMKTTFLSNMSHEIRTPLNGIIGFSELLMGEVMDPEQKEYIGIINKSAHRLLYTINDVMDVAKIEAGRVNILKEKFDLVPIVEDVWQFFHKQTTNIEIKLSKPDVREYMIENDKLKLQQVLINLVNNAIKFTPSGYVEIGFRAEADGVLIFVKDTGIGIPEDHHSRIFERFTQVEEGSARVYGGTGLGLSIVKEFTRLMGGKIWLESSPGEGSIFYLKFP